MEDEQLISIFLIVQVTLDEFTAGLRVHLGSTWTENLRPAAGQLYNEFVKNATERVEATKALAAKMKTGNFLLNNNDVIIIAQTFGR